MKRVLFLFSICFVFQIGSLHAANIDTSFKFSTIETEHFSIHFHQGLDETAQKTANIVEDLHSLLVSRFKWEPKERTQIVLIDDTDFANGFSTVLPYNTIYIKVVPPSIDMTTGEYEDWLKTIIAHEYIHILTMDTARGYSKVMRKIFGKPIPPLNSFSLMAFLLAAPPNVFLPLWWHEGMATWGETEFTDRGRGRSEFYEMILRMAVAENNIPSVDQINGKVPYWPGGHLPYIFGLMLQKYITEKYGKDALGKLNTIHAGRFPFFINGAVSRLFGKKYSTLFSEMIIDLKREEWKKIEILKQTPLTPIKIFDIRGEKNTNPRYSPNGELIAFNRRDPHRHEAILIAEKDGTNVKEIIRRFPSDRTICWSPDGNLIYFSQAEIKRGFNVYQDLYSYNLKREKVKRLTSGLRIKEADISHDGKKFAVIINKRGSQNLATIELNGENFRLKALTGFKFIRLANPRWSPDGKYIVYSLTDNNGRSGIHIYDIEKNEDRLLFENSDNNSHPTWSPDGRYIIYTSDETKVYNLYAYSIKDGKRYQITHILGGAFHPDVSPDGAGIIFSSYSSKGFKIACIEYNHEKWIKDHTPAIKTYWKEDNEPESYAGPKKVESLNNNQPAPVINQPRSYSAWRTLLPRFWLPTLYGDHEGMVVGAFTAGQDVIGYNTYMVQLDYGIASDKNYYNITYLNDYAYPTFMLQTYGLPALYSNLLQDEDYYEMNRSLVLSMHVPINRLESRYNFTLGYHIQEQETLSKEVVQPTQEDKLFQGKRNNIFAGIEFYNTLKYPYSISYEEGRKISLQHKYYSNEIGSDLNSREYIASYAEYFQMPSDYLRHHVIYLSLTGAASQGDRTLQQAFQIGGYPQQSEYPLRGYPSRFATGKYLATGTLEYRTPIWYIFRGIGTKPFFWDRLHMAVFADTGEVWDDRENFSTDRLKTGAGIETRLDMTLGYRLKITPTIGVAHGFNEGGETGVYFTINMDL